ALGLAEQFGRRNQHQMECGLLPGAALGCVSLHALAASVQPPYSMPAEHHHFGSPEQFVVEVFSELGCEVVQNRWREVNVILRLSMLVGLDMQMEATLNMIGDFAADVATHDAALIYLWDEDDEQVHARMSSGSEDI